MTNLEKTELALDNKILATWEQERPTPYLQDLIGKFATRIGLDEYDPEFAEMTELSQSDFELAA